jgi:hypothetical protein
MKLGDVIHLMMGQASMVKMVVMEEEEEEDGGTEVLHMEEGGVGIEEIKTLKNPNLKMMIIIPIMIADIVEEAILKRGLVN